VGALEVIAKAFRMTDESWRRHANPWSVWTRFAAIPLLILAIWSRDWIGWWCLLPLALVMIWLWVNPIAFPPVNEPKQWAAKGIYGERIWLQDKDIVPPGHRAILRLLVGLGTVGGGLLAWGLIDLALWPTIFGSTLIVLGQLWRIDRFGWLYDTVQSARTS
jgi:hypothetical protein